MIIEFDTEYGKIKISRAAMTNNGIEIQQILKSGRIFDLAFDSAKEARQIAYAILLLTETHNDGK